MNNWEYRNLSDIVTKVVDNRGKNPPYSSFGYEVIETSCISASADKFPDYSKVKKFVDKDTYENWFRSGHPVSGDVLIITVGNGIGRVSIMSENRGVITQNLIGLRFDLDKADPNYVYYYLNQKKVQHYLSGLDIGSAQPSLKVPHLLNTEIPVPSPEEQKAISAVPTSLDDKIYLLHRQNKTLEALAQTLFRHWFIDGADDDWGKKPLDEIADFLNGLACQKYPPENESERLPVLKIRELRSGISGRTDWATTQVPEKYIVENGDVIFSWSGSLMVKVWDGEECVLNQHLFKVTSVQFPKWFYYLWTIYHLQKFIAIAESKATTMGHIKRRDLSNSMVLVPSETELVEMDQICTPLFDKIVLNNRQIAKLTSLRDTLLTKLMSGEVRVMV